jgi:hypothetical protein
MVENNYEGDMVIRCLLYLIWKFGHPAPFLLRAVGRHLARVMIVESVADVKGKKWSMIGRRGYVRGREWKNCPHWQHNHNEPKLAT